VAPWTWGGPTLLRPMYERNKGGKRRLFFGEEGRRGSDKTKKSGLKEKSVEPENRKLENKKMNS